MLIKEITMEVYRDNEYRMLQYGSLKGKHYLAFEIWKGRSYDSKDVIVRVVKFEGDNYLLGDDYFYWQEYSPLKDLVFYKGYEVLAI